MVFHQRSAFSLSLVLFCSCTDVVLSFRFIHINVHSCIHFEKLSANETSYKFFYCLVKIYISHISRWHTYIANLYKGTGKTKARDQWEKRLIKKNKQFDKYLLFSPVFCFVFECYDFERYANEIGKT